MSEPTPPRLDPPGAGLPAPELFIARLMFATKRLLGTRASFSAQFERERGLILDLLASCEPVLRGRRALIPRLRGLEDSSRHWSVWMTLDHLRITNLVFAKVISALAQGRVPGQKASTADVKPDPGVTAEVEAAFEASCADVRAAVADVPDLRTSARYAHPWFGPLDAAGWQALAAMHLGIHRRQIERILRDLSA